MVVESSMLTFFPSLFCVFYQEKPISVLPLFSNICRRTEIYYFMMRNPVLRIRIRIRKDPHHFAGSGSTPKPMDPDPDPDADPTLFRPKLRKDVLQMN